MITEPRKPLGNRCLLQAAFPFLGGRALSPPTSVVPCLAPTPGPQCRLQMEMPQGCPYSAAQTLVSFLTAHIDQHWPSSRVRLAASSQPSHQPPSPLHGEAGVLSILQVKSQGQREKSAAALITQVARGSAETDGRWLTRGRQAFCTASHVRRGVARGPGGGLGRDRCEDVAPPPPLMLTLEPECRHVS